MDINDVIEQLYKLEDQRLASQECDVSELDAKINLFEIILEELILLNSK